MNNLTRPQPPPPAPFDVWAVLDFWLRRWRWLAGWTVALALAGAGLAHLVWGRSFTSTAQLIHYEPSAIDDTFHPRALSTPSLVLMLQAPGFLEKIGAQLQPARSAKELDQRLEITLDRNNDVATVTATGASREETVDLLGRYCAAAIAYTQAMQREEAISAGNKVNRQLALVEREIAAERASIAPAAALALDLPAAPAAPVSGLPQRIQAARDQLDDLLALYTEAHPLVREQRARLTALEDSQRRPALGGGAVPAARAAADPLSAGFYGRITPEEVALGERFRSLETDRALLADRQRAIQPFRDDPPGYFRVLLSVAADPTLRHNHRLEIVLCGCLGAFFGLMGSASQVLLGEFLDNRIKTRTDVRRVTGLPLLASLGDLRQLQPAERQQWAFRAWTAVQSRLGVSEGRGMVCGITSANRGDGRSTWIDLLAQAASDCGFRVLTVTAQLTTDLAPATGPRDSRRAAPEPPDADPLSLAPTASALPAPAQIVAQLSAPNGPPRVSVPLPGWVWNLERRQQWRAALGAWQAIEHIVIFVELPPASLPETVLLAETIPNLIWLADGNHSDAAETLCDLETLRAARCQLVGAVLNREGAAPVRRRFSRWLGSAALALVAGLWLAAPAASAQAAFSVVGPAQRADWQQRLTLGPGDVLSFHVFGYPELTREDVPIGPDGCVSFLEAENISAAGLTVDEFRARLNDELGRFRRAPQAFVTPVAYRSKKYYVLGAVVQKGVFPLDRPITIVEAVARAHGFETGLERGDTVETADFSHSFLARGGTRRPVDFARLFQHGDLSQNVVLEPDDYLYFPAAAAGEIFVLGEVRTPGPLACDPDASALSAIAARGGFTERAWRKRVLVVRGSLDQPVAFTVDVAGALAGRAANFALQPGDLVYVSSRPWIKAEELLDRAASAFVESAVVTWTGINVGPSIIRRPSLSP